MIKPTIFLLTLFAVMSAGLTGCTDRTKTTNDYDVYLLIGQSNMAGRGTMIEADTAAIEGVYLLNSEGQAEPAQNPLNKYSTIRKRLELQQINPGFSFGKIIHEKTGRPILLVVNAKGGSAVEQWMKTDTCGFYREAVLRTKQAMELGELKAILWHQGESNSTDPEGYLEKLSGMVRDLRADLGTDVPFIAGEIAEWHRNAHLFNPVIHRISSVIENSDYISSAGANQLIDDADPHFGREGQLLLGERYAEKVMEMVYNAKEKP